MVAMTVWPTDGGDGVVATELRWRKMAHLFARSGVVESIGQQMAPSLSGTSLTIQPGAVWIMGAYCEISTPTTIDVSGGGIVVVRFTASTNTAELILRSGLLGPLVDAPDGDQWEVAIYKYASGVGTDMRHFVNVRSDMQQFVLDNALNVTVPSGGTNSSMLVGTFTMPFRGDVTFYGSLKVANSPNLLIAVDPIEISTASTPAPTTHPPATWRVEAAPGAGQAIMHIPIIASWSDLPNNTVVTVRAGATVGGPGNLLVARASGVVTCVQNALYY